MSNEQGFSTLQRVYLAKCLVTQTEKQACEELEIDPSTPRQWKRRSPSFREAVDQVIETKLMRLKEAHTQALDLALEEIVNLTPKAVSELKKIVEKDWEKMSDRRASSKLKAIEDVLKYAGIEKQPAPAGKYVTSKRKLDMTKLIMDFNKGGDLTEATKELKDAGIDPTKLFEPVEGEFKEIIEEKKDK